MRAVLMVIQVFASLGIIGLVLIQRGKGADAGAGFGSGASGTVFGARGATTTLSRATAIFAAVFMICSLSLAYLGTRQSAAPKTLLDQIATEQQTGQMTGQPPVPQPVPQPIPQSVQPVAPAAAKPPLPATVVPAPVPTTPAAPK